MNVLVDALPSTVEIGGKKYPINTDFRAGVKFEMLIMKNEDNVITLLKPFFPDNMPADLAGALKAVELFFCCGSLPKKKEKPESKKIAYSFAVDSEAIFADFWQYYNIDLSQEGLHWWTFRALLFGLPEKSEFKQRIYYRTVDTKGLSKGEQKRIKKLRAIYEIKDETAPKLTLEERNAGWLSYLAKRTKETTGGGGIDG